jgi:hypothetical protein
MKKPLLSTGIDEIPEDRRLRQTDIPEGKVRRAEKRFENAKLHSRFNPSRIGFGILGITNDVGRPTEGMEEEHSPCSRRDRE